MQFTLLALRRLGAYGLVLALTACLYVNPVKASGMLGPVETHSDDKCPDGSPKDPELGCRQTTKAKRDKGDLRRDRKNSSKEHRAYKKRDHDRAKGSDKADKADREKSAPK